MPLVPAYGILVDMVDSGPKRTAGLLLLVVGGCVGHRADTPAPKPPAVAVRASRAVGAPLATTRASDTPVATDDLVGLDVTWIALQRLPTSDLLPLDAQSTLVTAPLADGAVLTRGRQARLVIFGGGLKARNVLEGLSRRAGGAAQQVAHQTAWVAPGTTVRFQCESVAPKRSVSLAVYRQAVSPTTVPATAPTARPADARFAITLDGIATTRPADDDAAGGPETAFVGPLPLAPDTPYVMILPWPGGQGPWKYLAAYVETISSPARADDVAEWNAWLADARGKPAGPATRPDDDPALRRALDALHADDPRPALSYLATVTGARIAGDVALVADATLLGKLRDSVTAADGPATTPEAVGWLLDRTALLTVADAAAKASLPPEMVAVLAVHAGEVGRHADTLTAIVNAVDGVADLRSRFVAENYIALEDNAASARVRAYDWLVAQGRAPADYDPLGPARARRAAINRAIAEPGGMP